MLKQGLEIAGEIGQRRCYINKHSKTIESYRKQLKVFKNCGKTCLKCSEKYRVWGMGYRSQERIKNFSIFKIFYKRQGLRIW